MADNITVKDASGSQETVRFDDLSSSKVQCIKIVLGADGAEDNLVDSGQQAMAASIPVAIASDQDFVKAEDTAHGSGDDGIMALAVRQDAAAILSGADGDYTPLIVDANGKLWVQTELPTAAALADALANPTTSIIGAAKHGFNGATWDRWRGNEELTLLASAARTVETNSGDQVNYNHRGLIIIVSVTVDGAAASITPNLKIKDSISGSYHEVWQAAAAIEAVGVYAYLFQPGGAAGSFTEAVNLRVGRTWRFQMEVADADAITYSVSAVMLI